VSAALRFVDMAAVSPLEGVSAPAWRRFVAAIMAQTSVVARGGALGVYHIRPRRLVEIGRATNFRRIDGRQVCSFIAPWTEKRFLSDPVAQYAVLVKSTRLYYDALRDGTIKRPDGMSMSGALSVLHSGGRGAIEGWPELFDGTKALFTRCNGVF
jgi:hypothetical protein